jgi:transcriptional regulator with XRE-family HTH domain
LSIGTLSSKKIAFRQNLFVLSAEEFVMKIEFWANMERARIEAKKERKAITSECGLTPNAFSRGLERKSDPGVSTAYRLARSVNKTIEELVDGEAGTQYLQEYIRAKGWGFSPPERIADIVEDVMGLSDDELIPIRGAIKAILEKKGGGPQAAADEQPLNKAN